MASLCRVGLQDTIEGLRNDHEEITPQRDETRRDHTVVPVEQKATQISDLESQEQSYSRIKDSS